MVLTASQWGLGYMPTPAGVFRGVRFWNAPYIKGRFQAGGFHLPDRKILLSDREEISRYQPVRIRDITGVGSSAGGRAQEQPPPPCHCPPPPLHTTAPELQNQSWVPGAAGRWGGRFHPVYVAGPPCPAVALASSSLQGKDRSAFSPKGTASRVRPPCLSESRQQLGWPQPVGAALQGSVLSLPLES